MLDLTQPEHNLRTYIKARASLQPEEIVFWWSGNIYSVIPGQKNRLLFKIDGYNIGRCVEVEGGYQQYLKMMTNMPIGHPFGRPAIQGKLRSPLLLTPIAKGRSYLENVSQSRSSAYPTRGRLRMV